MLAEEEQKLLARGAVPSRRVWRRIPTCCAIAESLEAKGRLGRFKGSLTSSTYGRSRCKVEQESKSRARASAAKALLSRSKPPKSPTTVSGVVGEEEEEDTSFHSHAGGGSRNRAPEKEFAACRRDLCEKGFEQSSPQGSSPAVLFYLHLPRAAETRCSRQQNSAARACGAR